MVTTKESTRHWCADITAHHSSLRSILLHSSEGFEFVRSRQRGLCISLEKNIGGAVDGPIWGSESRYAGEIRRTVEGITDSVPRAERVTSPAHLRLHPERPSTSTQSTLASSILDSRSWPQAPPQLSNDPRFYYPIIVTQRPPATANGRKRNQINYAVDSLW